MLRETHEVDRHTRYSEVKKKLSSDPRYRAVDSSTAREDWFREHIKHLKEERKRDKEKDRRDRKEFKKEEKKDRDLKKDEKERDKDKDNKDNKDNKDKDNKDKEKDKDKNVDNDHDDMPLHDPERSDVSENLLKLFNCFNKILKWKRFIFRLILIKKSIRKKIGKRRKRIGKNKPEWRLVFAREKKKFKELWRRT